MAAISFQRINKAAIAQRRIQKKLVTITTIFYGLAMLLFCLDAEGVGGGMGVMLGICGFLTGFVTFESTFNDLHNRQQADITLSMPMTGVERFLSKILCCFYVQIIPAMICSIVSGNVAFFLQDVAFNAEDFSYIWQTIFMIFAAELFVLALVSLCSSCCGTHGESVFFTVLLGVFQAAIPAMFIVRFIEQPSGINFLESHNMKWNLWGYGFTQAMEGSVYLVLLINVVVSIAILFAAGRIYAKRDARVVGTPVANKPFFEIMMFCGVMFIYLIFFFSEMTGWGILLAAIAFIIINIVVSRKNINARSFFIWTAKFAIITFIFLGISLSSIATGGFGYINAEPDINLDGSNVQIKIDVPVNTIIKNATLQDDETSVVSTHVYGKNLTDKQCREVMGIFRKYMKKGKPDISATLMGDYESNSCYFSLEKVCENTSGKHIDVRTMDKIPGCTYDYVYSSEDEIDYVKLNFKQYDFW